MVGMSLLKFILLRTETYNSTLNIKIYNIKILKGLYLLHNNRIQIFFISKFLTADG